MFFRRLLKSKSKAGPKTREHNKITHYVVNLLEKAYTRDNKCYAYESTFLKPEGALKAEGRTLNLEEQQEVVRANEIIVNANPLTEMKITFYSTSLHLGRRLLETLPEHPERDFDLLVACNFDAFWELRKEDIISWMNRTSKKFSLYVRKPVGREMSHFQLQLSNMFHALLLYMVDSVIEIEIFFGEFSTGNNLLSRNESILSYGDGLWQCRWNGVSAEKAFALSLAKYEVRGFRNYSMNLRIGPEFSRMLLRNYNRINLKISVPMRGREREANDFALIYVLLNKIYFNDLDLLTDAGFSKDSVKIILAIVERNVSPENILNPTLLFDRYLAKASTTRFPPKTIKFTTKRGF